MSVSKKVFSGWLLFFFFLGISSPGGASVLRSEEDSLACLQELSVASLALEKEMYKQALTSWRSLFFNCPDVSVRIYSDGVKLWHHQIGAAVNEEDRQAAIDTLLMVYDQRNTYFGDHEKYSSGWICGRKGMEILRYRRGNLKYLHEAYKCFEDSYNLMGDKTEPAVLVAWMESARVLQEKGVITGINFLRDFIKIYEHTGSDAFKKYYGSAIASKVNNALTIIFEKAGIQNCQVYEEAIGGLEFVKQFSGQEIAVYLEVLKMGGCDDSEIYASLLEQEYEVNPSSKAAGNLARLFIRQERFSRAVEFYTNAIDISENDSMKAVFYYELAVLQDAHFGKKVQATQLAKKASLLLPEWGKPHLLLGSIYARASDQIEGDEIAKNAVYWAAVDQFMVAMQKDSICKNEAMEQIEIFSQYFPDKQTCFFYGLEKGEEFVVGEWINESTIVRYR